MSNALWLEKLIPAEHVSFRPSVYGIIVQADKVLFVKMRSTGKLFLPGGGSEVDEHLEEALQTGLEIEIERFMGFKEDFYYYDPLDVAFHGLMFFYLCRPLTRQLAAGEQIEEGEAEKPRWVPIERLEDIHSHPEIILSALQKKDLPV